MGDNPYFDLVCKGKRKDGQTCHGMVRHDGYCQWHSPGKVKDRAESIRVIKHEFPDGIVWGVTNAERIFQGGAG